MGLAGGGHPSALLLMRFTGRQAGWLAGWLTGDFLSSLTPINRFSDLRDPPLLISPASLSGPRGFVDLDLALG